MTIDRDPPSGWRVLTGFVLAPAVPAFLLMSLAVLSGHGDGVFLFPLALGLGGYFPALVVGLPLYVILRRRVRPTWFNCALAGAFVAALPWAVIGLLTLVFLPSSVGSGVTDMMRQIAITGGLGASGGLVFWLVVQGPRRADA